MWMRKFVAAESSVVIPRLEEYLWSVFKLRAPTALRLILQENTIFGDEVEIGRMAMENDPKRSAFTDCPTVLGGDDVAGIAATALPFIHADVPSGGDLVMFETAMRRVAEKVESLVTQAVGAKGADDVRMVVIQLPWVRVDRENGTFKIGCIIVPAGYQHP